MTFLVTMVSQIENIFSKTSGRKAGEIKPGLDRIRRVYQHLGKPGSGTQTVLIGGTNGKGSTSAFLCRMLTGLGYRVGLFTSPHLWNFSERIQVSNMYAGEIDDIRLEREIVSLANDVPEHLYSPLSFFEINTLLAFRVFDEEQTDFNIVEVGLGGRWDSTNISNPAVSVITNIGWDHMDWLGDSLEKIAKEKSGVMRPGCPVVLGKAEGSAADVLRQCADESSSRLVEQNKLTELRPRSVLIHEQSYPLPSELWDAPEYLKHNYVTAMLAAGELLGGTSDFSLGAPPVCQRGRFERGFTRDGQPYVIDVCHNVDGVEAFIAGLRNAGYLTQRPKVYVSMLRDKQVERVLMLLTEVMDVQIFLSSGERCLRREDIPEAFSDLPIHHDFAAALKSHGAEDTIIVCGSIHALAAALRDLTSDLSTY